jgi:hypothetical protein
MRRRRSNPQRSARNARRLLLIAGGLLATVTAGCQTLLSAEPTPVPGAAATLTRSINTPIPTPVRTPGASPAASPSPARVAVAASGSPSPAASAQATSDADVADVQRRLEQILATPDLRGIEALLLDHVSLSTVGGGDVLDSSGAASWLREHAGPGLRVTRLERGTQEVMLQVETEGWPIKDPIQLGLVTFGLRRYDANGRQDETGGGDWKIDVIGVE